jgi:hypothetical protein
MNCTVADNTGSNINGDGLWRANGAWFEVHNSIFWGLNGDLLFDLGGQSWTSTIDYSDTPNTNGPITPGMNMLNAAPMFVNGPMNDYRLMAGSPCIDAGTPVNAPAIDLDGFPRSAIPDMGAYETEATGLPEPTATACAVFPNPAGDELLLVHDPAARTARLFDMDGRSLAEFNLHPSGRTKLDVSGLTAGMYVVTVDQAARVKVLKR